MSQMKKMGGMSAMMGMMPGMGMGKMPDVDTDAAEKQLARTEAIIYSMTPEERRNPKLMNPSRKRRIAAGAGVDISEVNRLVKQIEQMKKMMKQMPGLMGGRRGRVAAALMVQTAVNANTLAQALGGHDTGLGVPQLILQGRGAGVDDQNVHWNLNVKVTIYPDSACLSNRVYTNCVNFDIL